LRISLWSFGKLLKKDASSFSMGTWARGKHLLSLGRTREAAEAFQESLNCEQIAARENGQDPSSLETAPGGLLNSRAFLWLVDGTIRPAGGNAMLEETITILRNRWRTAKRNERRCPGVSRPNSGVHQARLT
jgi:hypothetical protein